MSTLLPQTVRASVRILGLTRSITGHVQEGRLMEDRIERVVAIFRRLKADWALVGAHAVGTISTPRATVDFDFVVEESKLRPIVRALEEEFGELDAVDLGPAFRCRALDVDLIRSTTHPLFQEALRRVRSVGDWPIPIPEVLIALKFLAAVNPWRDRTKRMYDVADLRSLYLTIGKDELDGELMKTLSALVYPGAETEFAALLEKIDKGEPIAI